MNTDHIMTADEIDALFKDDSNVKEAINPKVKVTFIKTGRMKTSSDRTQIVLMCAIWNNSSQKVSLGVNSYVINNKREQYRSNGSLNGYDVSAFVDIRPNAHVIKGDIFYEEYTGTASPGWIYGVEIVDLKEINIQYDTEFELKRDGVWQEKKA